MRWLAVLLAGAIISTALAQTSPHLTTASAVLSAVRIALNLGNGRQDYQQVDVVSEGATLEQARQEGFRIAVSQAVGTVVATQTQSQNQHITRDEIVAYSSGFVDRFEILEQTVVPNRTRLRMRVWVAESRLAHRLLGNSVDNQSIDGTKLSTQIHTIIQERQAGDRLMVAVMQDFPERSFRVETRSSRVKFGADRRAVMEVPVSVSWDPRWLDSLTDVLRRTNDPGKDWQVYNAVNTANPVLRVSAVDSHDRELISQCYVLVMTRGQVSYNYPNRFAVDIQRDRLVIDYRYQLKSSVNFPLGTDTELIQKITKIQAKIVPQKSC